MHEKLHSNFDCQRHLLHFWQGLMPKDYSVTTFIIIFCHDKKKHSLAQALFQFKVICSDIIKDPVAFKR